MDCSELRKNLGKLKKALFLVIYSLKEISS